MKMLSAILTLLYVYIINFKKGNIMKTKPAKLLLALLFGMSSMAFVSTSAFAADSKESKDSKDSKVSENTAQCKGVVNNSCGVSVIVTTCTGSSTPTDDKDADKSKDKDSKSDKSKSDKDRADNDDSHRDHADRSAGEKVSICHRAGGARQTLLVANDGWLSGHSKHTLDTVGRCVDFDDAKNDDSKKDSDKDISASDAGYKKLTPSQIDCLSNLPGNVSFQPGTRGGARTLH